MDVPLTQEAAQEPSDGDLVHVVGHGPAVVVRVPQPKQPGYDVRYPNGDTECVERGVILAHQPGVGTKSPSVGSPAGPRRLEYLGRAFDDEGRTIRTHSATFSLIATMVGGGVLSLPYAMSQCGLVLGIAVLIISAILSAWTLDMLVECARATGRDTYELVGHAAFGEWCRRLTMLLVFSMTWLATVAYFVLLQDLLAPTAELIAPGAFESMSQEGVRRVVVTMAALLLSPMCYKGNLSALRFLCFASVSSVLLVGCLLGYRALSVAGKEHEISIMNPDKSNTSLQITAALSLWPTSYSQALYVVPMFGVSFLCHFNALPTHHELQRPTRDRMRRVLTLCLCFTTMLYGLVSVAGIMWAGNCTCGNILLNFARDDILITVGRAALGLVLMFNFPLLVQPSRNSLFRLIIAAGYAPPEVEAGASACEAGRATTADIVMVGSNSPSSGGSVELGAMGGAQAQKANAPGARESVPAGAGAPPQEPREERVAEPADPPVVVGASPTGPSAMRRTSTDSGSHVHAYIRENTRGMMRKGSKVMPVDTFLPKDETVQQSGAQPSVAQRSIMTTGILVSSLLLSMFMKSILVVWSVLGSTVAFMIAFIMPAAFWYKLIGPHTQVRRHVVGVLLVIFIVLAIVCSALTALNLDAPPCPVLERIARHRELPYAPALRPPPS